MTDQKRNRYPFPPPQNHVVQIVDGPDWTINKVDAWVPVNLTEGDQRDFPDPQGTMPTGYPSTAVNVREPGTRGPKKLG